MSGDPEQNYFADGIVEDITTILSRFKSLFVIARNSSFTYKGKTVDIKQIGRELGVRYVLEGSVRKSAGRVRITGQLIEAATGAHLWADRFDGDLQDIFELQDEVTSRVVGSIAPMITQAEGERLKRKPDATLDSYDLYLRGSGYAARGDYRKALGYLYRVIEKDEEFGLAYAAAANSLLMIHIAQGAPLSEPEKLDAIRFANRAVALASDDAAVLSRAGHALAFFAKSTTEPR